MRTRTPFATTVVLLTAVLLPGCSKKITINQIPEFYDPSIRTIAITPFRNQTRAPSAGNIISDKLAGLLTSNGTYKVYNRSHLAVLSDERDLELDLGKAPAKVDAMFQRLTNVQAILTGAVSIYHATPHHETRRRPVYAYNSYTKQTYISHYVPYKYTRYDATVEVSAALLRGDGTTIHATPGPIRVHRYAEGSPPNKDMYTLLGEAADEVIRRLLEQFAVVRKQVRVNPAKALRTASDLHENRWTYTDRFPHDGEKMYVVVNLPRSCDRNRFEIRIVRKNRREYLATQKIVWNGRDTDGGRGYVFSPSLIAEKGGGSGAYTVKFFSGPQPIFSRDFRIR